MRLVASLAVGVVAAIGPVPLAHAGARHPVPFAVETCPGSIDVRGHVRRDHVGMTSFVYAKGPNCSEAYRVVIGLARGHIRPGVRYTRVAVSRTSVWACSEYVTLDGRRSRLPPGAGTDIPPGTTSAYDTTRCRALRGRRDRRISSRTRNLLVPDEDIARDARAIYAIARAGRRAVLRGQPAVVCALLDDRARANAVKYSGDYAVARTRRPMPTTCEQAVGYLITDVRAGGQIREVLREPRFKELRILGISGNRARVELGEGIFRSFDIDLRRTAAGWRGDSASFEPFGTPFSP